MDIKGTFQKIRVPMSFVVAAIFLIFSKPSLRFFYIGIPVGISGLAIRLWAAGHIVKSKKLTKSGPYQFTRNPLYLGSFLIGSGLSIQCGGFVFLLFFSLIYLAIYFPVMKREEEEMECVFGNEFKKYREDVPLFFPYFLKRIRCGERFSFRQAVNNREYNSVIGFLFMECILILKFLLAGGV